MAEEIRWSVLNMLILAPLYSGNYWTAVLYFRAQNGSYKRVHQMGNNQFRTANGGLTVYYMQDAIYETQQKSKVTAFKPVHLHLKTSSVT